MSGRAATTQSRVRWVGLLAGPTIAVRVCFLLPETFQKTGGQRVVFSHAGRVTAPGT